MDNDKRNLLATPFQINPIFGTNCCTFCSMLEINCIVLYCVALHCIALYFVLYCVTRHNNASRTQIHHNGMHDNHVQLPSWARTLFLHWIAWGLGMASNITTDQEHTNKLSTYESEIIVGKARQPALPSHSLNTFTQIHPVQAIVTVESPFEVIDSITIIYINW